MDSVFQSNLIDFIVGPTCRRVTVHSALLSAAPWSNVLKATSQTQGPISVKVPDAVEDIFVYFCQYLYTADYNIPLPDDTPPCYAGSERCRALGWNHVLQLGGNIFRNRDSIQLTSNHLIGEMSPPPASAGHCHQFHPCWDYDDILLAHARLHLFAAKYGLSKLHDLSLFKLLHLLHKFPLHPRRVGDLLVLLRFVFQEKDTTYDHIQELMIHYITRHIKFLINNEDFKGLLEDIPCLNNQLLRTLVEFLGE